MSVQFLQPRRSSFVPRRLFPNASGASKILFVLCFAAALLAPGAAFARKKTLDVCTLSTSWTSRLNKVMDNTYLIDEFRPTLDGEAETEKYYKHKESGLIVSVGVRYDDGFMDGFGGKPTEMKLAVAVGDAEQPALNVPESAFAGVNNYRKNRLNIFVEKQTVVGDLTYSFVLECRADKKQTLSPQSSKRRFSAFD